MAELKKQEIRSPELQEVMSEIPGSFLRWGLFIFFAIIIIMVGGSYLIKNPEVITVPVVITTRNPPVILVARSGGEIKRLFVSEGSSVNENDVVAIIGNTATYEDVQKLSNLLSEFDEKTDWIEVVKKKQQPGDLSLGELQSSYTQLQNVWAQLKDYLDQAYIPTKLSLLEKQIAMKTEYNAELEQQKKFQTEDLDLAKKSFERDSILFKSGAYSISTTEFERSRQSYLQKLSSNSSFNLSLKNNEAEFLRLRESRLDLQLQYEKELLQYALSIAENIKQLRSSVIQWEEKYVIKSTVAGKISLNKFRNELQVIKAGETLANVIPEDPAEIIVRAVIPVSGFANIEIGQTANIKLSGFPYMQYGVLKGKIYSLSQVPGEDGFIADIELTEGMTSTYKEKIKFIQQMDGTADIITKEMRLINRFIKPIKSGLKN